MSEIFFINKNFSNFSNKALLIMLENLNFALANTEEEKKKYFNIVFGIKNELRKRNKSMIKN